jgi:hypothetical protein
MNTLLFINTNECDVQIVGTICHAAIIVTGIIVGGLIAIPLAKALLEWVKLLGNTPDSKEVERNLELQKLDRAKALVKDFYEATKDKEQKKDLGTAKELLKMYEEVMAGSTKQD